MNLAFKIIVFSLAINMATGITNIAVVDNAGDPVFDSLSERSGMTYNSSDVDSFTGGVNSAVNPSTGEIQDSGDANYRVLDMLGLGFIGRFLDVINNYMFGFLNLLQNLFTPIMGASAAVIFGILKGVITISYVLAAWALFTGKDIKE